MSRKEGTFWVLIEISVGGLCFSSHTHMKCTSTRYIFFF